MRLRFSLRAYTPRQLQRYFERMPHHTFYTLRTLFPVTILDLSESTSIGSTSRMFHHRMIAYIVCPSRGSMKIPEIDRRTFIQMTAATGTMSAIPYAEAAPPETGIINQSVSLRVNGKVHKIEVDTRATLLDTLREQLQLFGTKKGCDHGQCGACTVHVNGRRINSCLTLAVMHDGAEVTTIEGLAQDGQLHPV